MTIRKVFENIYNQLGGPGIITVIGGILFLGFMAGVILSPTAYKKVIIEKVLGPYSSQYEIFDALKDFPGIESWSLEFDSRAGYREAPFDITINTDKERYTFNERHFEQLIQDINKLKADLAK